MCGILFTNDQRVDEDSFQKAILKIQRRGPDACGSKHFGMVKLGHTRLKIQDLVRRKKAVFYNYNVLEKNVHS